MATDDVTDSGPEAVEHDVAALEDLPDGGKLKVKVAGTSVVLLRSGDEVFAIRNRCGHMKFPLSVGKFDGTHLTCRLHGARWDVRTGELDKKAWLLGGVGSDCVPVYPVSVRDGRIHVVPVPLPEPDRDTD